MTAAPELLAALEAVQHELEALHGCIGWKEAQGDGDSTLEWVGPRTSKALDTAREAIRKARGEEEA